MTFFPNRSLSDKFVFFKHFPAPFMIFKERQRKRQNEKATQ